LLHDPETKQPLTTSETIFFSRFMLAMPDDWRVIRLRPKAKLKAAIAVSAPDDLAKWNLADVDKAGEIERAREGLAGIEATTVGEGLPLTLVSLITLDGWFPLLFYHHCLWPTCAQHLCFAILTSGREVLTLKGHSNASV
jgi:hypothetical protein